MQILLYFTPNLRDLPKLGSTLKKFSPEGLRVVSSLSLTQLPQSWTTGREPMTEQPLGQPEPWASNIPLSLAQQAMILF